jgi:alanyl-tRNA synthetase
MNSNKEQVYIRILYFVFGAAVSFFAYPSVSKQTETIEKIKKQYEQKLVEETMLVQNQLFEMSDKHEQEIKSIKKDFSLREEQLSTKINSLIQENSSLKRKTKTTTIEKISPDGHIERRTVSEDTLETVTQRTAEIKEEAEKKLRDTVEKIQQDHERKIEQLTAKNQIELNESNIKIKKIETLLAEEKTKNETIKTNEKKLGVGVGYNSDALYKIHGHYNFWGPVFLGFDVDTNGYTKNRAAITLGLGI